MNYFKRKRLEREAISLEITRRADELEKLQNESLILNYRSIEKNFHNFKFNVRCIPNMYSNLDDVEYTIYFSVNDFKCNETIKNMDDFNKIERLTTIHKIHVNYDDALRIFNHEKNNVKEEDE